MNWSLLKHSLFRLLEAALLRTERPQAVFAEIERLKNEVNELRQVQEFADFPPDVQDAAAGITEMQTRG